MCGGDLLSPAENRWALGGLGGGGGYARLPTLHLLGVKILPANAPRWHGALRYLAAPGAVDRLRSLSSKCPEGHI